MKRREIALRLPMTADEIRLVRALAGCPLRSGSADERFCSDLAAITRRQKSVRLTEGQSAYLWRIAYRYVAVLPRRSPGSWRLGRRPVRIRRPPARNERRNLGGRRICRLSGEGEVTRSLGSSPSAASVMGLS